MKKFLINVYTSWCGEDNTYSAIADNDSQLLDKAQDLAYNNFIDFGGFEAVLNELFPVVVNEEYSDEKRDEAADNELDYYAFTIEEWDETRPKEEWDWYDLVYDGNE